MFAFTFQCLFFYLIQYVLFVKTEEFGLYYVVADQFCTKYSQTIGDMDVSATIENDFRSKEKDCSLLGTSLVVGGTEASVGEFPHQVELGYSTNTGIKWVCGGSLISDEFVLTAAHCINSNMGKPQFVRFQVVNRHSRDANKNVLNIVNHIVYPHYIEGDNYLYHDIALVQFAPKMAISDQLKPACLDTRSYVVNPRSAIVSGFGKVSFRAASSSPQLLKANVDIFDYDSCSKMVPFVSSIQICAGVLSGKRDTCQGDSGGPLQIILPYPLCMYNIIGITSYGKACGLPHSPGVYTGVAFYIPWIVHFVWSDQVPDSDYSAVVNFSKYFLTEFQE